ncbi:hypothetical protein JGU71_18260 [Antrihabitans sp. YC3-6]|uniref:Uncharacterized protein n=1 Tax=Antrihabitans stalagmiti TaxID=2799499 RepID=A0A934U4Z3_9NOCA|nr:hypothetical protein [Antrihabitans stalagmiti]MBJ8340832.1 hypothetical protein [Antrihabitans stalagmiti]
MASSGSITAEFAMAGAVIAAAAMHTSKPVETEVVIAIASRVTAGDRGRTEESDRNSSFGEVDTLVAASGSSSRILTKAADPAG